MAKKHLHKPKIEKVIKVKSSILPNKDIKIDYKDVNLLRKFLTEKGKIRSRKITGNSVQRQREIATAVKNAREMALLSYIPNSRQGDHR